MPNSDESKSKETQIKLSQDLSIDMEKVDSLNTDYFTTSRYGRQRKPKITEDFYCTDDVIAPLVSLNKSNGPNKYLSKQSVSKTDMKKLRYTVKFKKIVPDIYMNSSQNEHEVDDRNNRISVDIDTSENELDKDYNEVLKIVSRCTVNVTSPNTQKTALKTYSNRKKHVCNALNFNDDVISQINTYSWIESVPDTLLSFKQDDSIGKCKTICNEIFKNENKISDDLNKNLELKENIECNIKSKINNKQEQSKNDVDTKLNISENPPKSNSSLNHLNHDIGLKIIEDFTSDTTSQDTLILDKYSAPDIDEIKFQTLTCSLLKNEDFENNEDNGTSQIWNVGDLAWARIGKHPFWPCLITMDPELNVYTKTQIKGRDGKPVKSIHVRFFGDSGRRAWVLSYCLLPFQGKENFDQLAQKVTIDMKRKEPKYAAAFIITPSKMSKWIKALTEATSLLMSKIEDRLNFFCNMFEVQSKQSYEKRKLLKRKLSLSESNSDLSLKKKKRKLRSDVLKLSKEMLKNSSCKDNECLKQELLTNEEKIKSNLIVHQKPTSEINKPETRKSKQESLIVTEKICDKTSVIEDFDGYVLENKEAVCRRNPNFTEIDVINYLKKHWTELQEKNACKKESNSSESKINVSSVIRHKRNNLFKGVTKQRVCQFCEKTGNVVKCKGCLKLYHVECLKKLDNEYLKEIQQIKDNTCQDDNLNTMKDVNRENGVILSTEDINKKIESLCAIKKSIVIDSDSKEKVIENCNMMNTTNFVSNFNTGKIDSTTEDTCSFSKSTLLSVEEQIDAKLKEVMGQLGDVNKYTETTTEESSSESEMNTSCTFKSKNVSYHVTGDDPVPKINNEKKSLKKSVSAKESHEFLCNDCLDGRVPSCFICSRYIHQQSKSEDRQKCTIGHCGRFYHRECLELWPQTHWATGAPSKNSKKFDRYFRAVTCPSHVCHTCMSDNPHGVKLRFNNEKLAKCIRCPTAYHANNFCVPAGSLILTANQIVCPKHVGRLEKTIRIGKLKSMQHVNASWCFICAVGGSLICCETCPTSFHAECLRISPPEGSYICEDCETGRFPLYDEIVWVKLGNYRWWPAQILFPNEIPANVKAIPHNDGDFVVRFFGSHDHYWVNRGRVFLYQEGDTGRSNRRSNVDELFLKAVSEAAIAFSVYKDERENREAEVRNEMKPPLYIRIKSNKPVGNVRVVETHASSMTTCECDPNGLDPCGPDSDCLNRILLTECNPQVCPAGERCKNQAFEKRIYPELIPFRTAGRGWGLKTISPLSKGQFVIEYVGEMIDEEEYQRRLKCMNEQKDENYYFLTIDKDRILDAGPKGNVARFMNHSCQPNCETQKWTVNGDTRVGLFALVDIPANTELTFNYNLECVGKAKKQCKCGAAMCSGFIGVKVKQEEVPKKNQKVHKLRSKKRRSKFKKHKLTICFICGKEKTEVRCSIKYCSKDYHYTCINLELLPEGKWLCPRHRCKVCHKKKVKFCSKCVSAYCNKHANGNLTYTSSTIVCKAHKDQRQKLRKNNLEQNKDNKSNDKLEVEENKINEDKNVQTSCSANSTTKLELNNVKLMNSSQLKHLNKDSTPSSSNNELLTSFIITDASSNEKKHNSRLLETMNDNLEHKENIVKSNACTVDISDSLSSEKQKNDHIQLKNQNQSIYDTLIDNPLSLKRKRGRPKNRTTCDLDHYKNELKHVKNGFIENIHDHNEVDSTSSKLKDSSLSDTEQIIINKSIKKKENMTSDISCSNNISSIQIKKTFSNNVLSDKLFKKSTIELNKNNSKCDEKNLKIIQSQVDYCVESNINHIVPINVNSNNFQKQNTIELKGVLAIKLDKNLPIRKRTGLRSLSLARSS